MDNTKPSEKDRLHSNFGVIKSIEMNLLRAVPELAPYKSENPAKARLILNKITEFIYDLKRN